MLNLRHLFQSNFVRSVSVLAAGTALAQGLGVLALPLLTRIYTPEEYGLLAVFMALLAMTAPIATLRYEIAIPLPESDQAAASLLAVSLFCVAATTTVVAVAIFLFGQQIVSLVNAPLFAKYLWLLPIGIAVTGAYSVFQYWATRKKAFARIARTRIERSVGGVFTQLFMGWAGTGALGLIIGQVVSNGAGFFGLARRAFMEDRAELKSVRISGMKKVAQEYDRQPKYSAVETLTNNAGVQLPIILIASLATNSEVGYLMLAMQIMQAPMGIMGASISQVYLTYAVEEHRNGRLGDFTACTMGGLAKIGAGPLVFVGIVAPSVFDIIFGAEWKRAGELVAWMTPWFVFQFMVSPVSMALLVTNKQITSLVLQVTGLALRVLLVLTSSLVMEGKFVTEVFAISGFLFYLIYFFAVCQVSNITFGHGVIIAKGAIPAIVVSIFLAIIFLMTFNLFL